MSAGRRAFSPPSAGSPIQWLIVAVVTIAFFVAVHEPTRSRLISDLYQVDEATMYKSVSEGTLKRQVGFLVLGAMGALVLVSPFRRKVELNGALALLVLFFLTWMAASVTWAVDPGITLRRLIVIFMFCLGSVAVAASMDIKRVGILVFASSGAYLAVGILSELALGNFHPGVGAYRFSGTLHPNVQAANCSLLLLAGFAAIHSAQRWRSYYIAITLLSFVFLVLTGSRTGLASLMLTMMFYVAVVYRQSRLAHFGFFLSVTVGLLIVFIGQDWLGEVIEKVILLGRGDQNIGGAKNLTGRLPLWQQLLEYAAHRPIQGYGYGSFFTVNHIQELSARQHWAIASCHNVFLEVLMGLGIVGVVCYTLIQIMAVVRSLQYYGDTGDQTYVLFASLLVLGSISGLAESTLLVPTMQTFVQFLIIAVLAFQPPPVPVLQPQSIALRGRPRLETHRKGPANAPLQHLS